MIQHPRSYTEPLSTEDADAVLEASLRVLGEVGMVIQSDEARARLSDAGARIEQGTGRVRFPSDLVQAHLRSAPSQFLLHARNPARSVEVGGDCLLVSPGYGSAFVADSKGKRRYAVMEDVRTFARLAGAAECIGITGGLLVEPSDVAPELRPLEMTRVLLTYSDKPFFGSVAGAEGAQDSIEMARIAMGDLSDQPTVLALININSPLRLDARMADALLTYVKAGQPILLTPGILMGVTAPVTPAGALVQGTAELIGGVTLAQVVRPGAPVIIGIGGFGADMRTGGSGFGRPENALGTLMGAQMARRLDLPYRCSAATTGSMLPDCRSGYERMVTALCGWNAGAHVCLQTIPGNSVRGGCVERAGSAEQSGHHVDAVPEVADPKVLVWPVLIVVVIGDRENHEWGPERGDVVQRHRPPERGHHQRLFSGGMSHLLANPIRLWEARIGAHVTVDPVVVVVEDREYPAQAREVSGLAQVQQLRPAEYWRVDHRFRRLRGLTGQTITLVGDSANEAVVALHPVEVVQGSHDREGIEAVPPEDGHEARVPLENLVGEGLVEVLVSESVLCCAGNNVVLG